MKVKFFLNQPPGKTWSRLKSIVPGLGDKFGIEIEIVEKTRDEYLSESYIGTKLPVAPSIMIDEEVIDAHSIIARSQLEKIIANRIKANTQGATE